MKRCRGFLNAVTMSTASITSITSRRALLPAVVLLASGGLAPEKYHLWASAAECTATPTTPIQVSNLAGVHTLQAAVNCTSGGQIEAVWTGSVTLDGTIAVSAGTFLSITGEDDTAEAVGAAAGPRLFQLSPGATLDITGLRLTGGTDTDGGAILSLGTLTLENCLVEDNQATSGSGGALRVEGGAVTVTGGEFLRNTATWNGGAISAVDATLTVEDEAKFEGNKAVRGGAIYFVGLSELPGLPDDLPVLSLSDSHFVNNSAWSEKDINIEDDYKLGSTWHWLHGGGALSLAHTKANVTGCNFSANEAQVSGGAVFSGNGTAPSFNNCSFFDNKTPGFGGAVSAGSAVVTGGTLMKLNTAEIDGGAVFGWNRNGSVEFDTVLCTNNTGVGKGGCLSAHGEAVIRNGTVMTDNSAVKGGCIYVASLGKVRVYDGEFTSCQATGNDGNGAFMFASAGSVVHISGGVVRGNIAERRAGAVYCSGGKAEENLTGSAVTISGGTFEDNKANELGGAISAWGSTTVVVITGGLFNNNTARYFGGFLFLEEEASVDCKGAIVSENSAGEHGGGIYGRDATWLTVSCDLFGNQSPEGAGAYLTHTKDNATFRDMQMTANVAEGGSTVYAVNSKVVAQGVTFDAGARNLEERSNRAVHLEHRSTFEGVNCMFDNWIGDTVVQSSGHESGSLVLDGCDFCTSASAVAVVSPYSEAEIRNAFLSDLTIKSAANPEVLVDRVVTCSETGICDSVGECVDSLLGVLCECLPGGSCLDDPGTVSLAIKKWPSKETYLPDPILFDLVVSAADDGTTESIWELDFESSELELEVIPSSGILRSGSNITVMVSGTPLTDDVGGNLTSSFVLTAVGDKDNQAVAVTTELKVMSTFFLCRGFQFAVPGEGNESSGGVVECLSCTSLSGHTEGVDCGDPGATLASLPLKEGYWRENSQSKTVHACIHSEACVGAADIITSNDYCADGYTGPYCAVCEEGYGKGVGNKCHKCDGTKADLLTVLGALFFLAVGAFLILAIVYLIGGLDAVGSMRNSIASSLHVGNISSARVSTRSSRLVTMSDAVSPHTSFGGMPSNNRTMVVGDPVVEEDSTDAIQQFAPTVNPVSIRETSVDRNTAGAGQRTYEGREQCRGGLSLPEAGTEPRRASEASSVSDIGMSNAGLLTAPDGRREGVPGSGRGMGIGTMAAGSAAAAGTAAGSEETERSECCGVGSKIKRLMSRLPLDKLKILVVVWQILTVFPSITAVEFPPSYTRFLNWIDFVNLDLGQIFSASCLLPRMTHYEKLLMATLGPLIVLLILVVTYQLAKRRAGIGSAGIVARRAAWSRHMAAGLLVTFLVFTSVSTLIFRTFACDNNAMSGRSFLTADYSISCDSNTHTVFEVYAGLMILVYPLGIPLLYFVILWTNRQSLNPVLEASKRAETEAAAALESALAAESSDREAAQNSFFRSYASGWRLPKSQEETDEFNERVKMRNTNPDLVPSMFLWKDFGPDLYYYEVIECGRRILLTGVLIFIAPHSPSQAAMACIFAFASLLGFELLRPHLDPTDSWLYRLGCVVIFLSNFLALLIKVEAAGDGRRDALGGLLVAINVGLVLAVIITSWFATQQSVDDSRDDDNTLNVIQSMMTAERLDSNVAHRSRPSDTAQATNASVSGVILGTNSSVGRATAPPRLAATSVGSPVVTSQLSGSNPLSSGNAGVVRHTRVSGNFANANFSDASLTGPPARRWGSGSGVGGGGLVLGSGGFKGWKQQNDPEKLWKQDKGES